MTRLLLVALLLGVVPSQTEAAWAFVSSVAAGSPDQSTVTTGAIDTTGANTIVCYIAEQESIADSSINDSKGGTWQTDITPRSDTVTFSLLGRMFYCKNCTVGTGHTFTATDNGGGPKPSIACAAFSGGHTTAPLDQQDGLVDTDGGLSNTTGGITPSENDTLVVTGLGFGGGAATTISIGDSYTLTDQVDYTANHRGVALAYKIQTTATATDPTWSYTANAYALTSIASFKISGGGGGPTSRPCCLGVF